MPKIITITTSFSVAAIVGSASCPIYSYISSLSTYASLFKDRLLNTSKSVHEYNWKGRLKSLKAVLADKE